MMKYYREKKKIDEQEEHKEDRPQLNKSTSSRLHMNARRASAYFRPAKSERDLNSSSSNNLKSPRPISSGSSRHFQHASDEDQEKHTFRQKGFDKIKGMWNTKESTVGFSNPLSTWSRPYANVGSSKSNNKDASSSADEPNFIHFAKSIEDVPRTTLDHYKEPIPTVLVMLRDELEKSGGFLVEGVMRIAASVYDQKSFKLQIDQGAFQGCNGQDDSMCMAALIKEWFREMPVRLLNVLPVTALRAGEADLNTQLPEPNHSIFLWLVDLMADICEHEQVNRMSARAMAIVIAPNLYATLDDASPQDIVQETNGAVQIVEEALKQEMALRQSNNKQNDELDSNNNNNNNKDSKDDDENNKQPEETS